ncbi:hypothetical protein DPMN_045567 [Dreissena polymorpha]|uniref:Uncharacterized protein n=1 Tax=Dreissena polymorpha TaxID=45954 RepID=A0A9D4HZR7_DREPO|nr:hypothetical protein DPMN_045567 [Dreissena polymorpha]
MTLLDSTIQFDGPSSGDTVADPIVINGNDNENASSSVMDAPFDEQQFKMGLLRTLYRDNSQCHQPVLKVRPYTFPEKFYGLKNRSSR